MSIANYTELQTYLALLLTREGDADVTTYIPDFIKMAEVDLNLNLYARELVASVDINPSPTNKYVPLPAGFMSVISFTDNFGTPMQELTMEEIESLRYSNVDGSTNRYALTSRIEFDRTAPASLVYPMTYWKRLDLATDATNDILTNYPNLYVYTAAIHAAPFINDDKRIQTWATLAKTTMDSLNNRATKNKKKMRTDIAARQKFNILKVQ